MPEPFQDKTVVVTGGARGIGNAIARAFHDAGARVIATGTREPGAYETNLSGLEYLRLDLRDSAGLSALAERLDSLDVLVNNAAIVRYDKQEFGVDTFRDVIETNLISVMEWSTALYGPLSAAKGCIVNIGSLAGAMGARGNPAYAASKGGIEALSKSLALAWGRKGIRVSVVSPGFVETDLTAKSQENEAIRQAVEARTPLGRWGQADEIAASVLALAHPANTFATGAVLRVDGGYSLVI